MENLTTELKEAKLVLNKEAHAIQLVAERLNAETFSHAVDILFQKDHKIVISGIGKSGHVGKKIAAMFCSTGSPASFLHPSEAVHGDLGIHQEGDPVIFLSNSGSTPELLYLEPVFRSRGAKIVGILGKQHSPLTTKVDISLDASVCEEADPLGIVPTASFAAATALGHAIGSALMKRRNFDSNEYAKTHPAGQLGRNLILKVKNVYHPIEKVACVKESSSIKEIVIQMSKYPLGGACVLDGNKLLGIVTDGDLRRALLKTEDINNVKATDIMTRNPQTISLEESLGNALKQMEQREPTPISILPVTCSEQNSLMGLIRLHDVLG